MKKTRQFRIEVIISALVLSQIPTLIFIQFERCNQMDQAQI